MTHEKKTATIVVRLTPNLKEKVKKDADDEFVKMSDIIRHILSRHYGIETA